MRTNETMFTGSSAASICDVDDELVHAVRPVNSLLLCLKISHVTELDEWGGNLNRCAQDLSSVEWDLSLLTDLFTVRAQKAAEDDARRAASASAAGSRSQPALSTDELDLRSQRLDRGRLALIEIVSVLQVPL